MQEEEQRRDGNVASQTKEECISRTKCNASNLKNKQHKKLTRSAGRKTFECPQNDVFLLAFNANKNIRPITSILVGGASVPHPPFL